MDEKLKITPDNYKGYCELYKTYFVSDDKYISYLKPTLKTIGLSVFLLVSATIFNAPIFILNLATVNLCIMPFIVLGKTIKSEKNRMEKYFFKNYPNIDTKISYDELRKALEETKILKYNANELDIKGYIDYIECEKIKDEIINEHTYEIVQASFSVPDEELEKSKVKIKTMTRK